jgi:hypothetical protein
MSIGSLTRNARKKYKNSREKKIPKIDELPSV